MHLTSNEQRESGHSRSIRRVWQLGALISVFMFSACSDLTDVSAPDIVAPSSLDNPSGALTREAGAVALFATSVSSAVLFSGMIGDEFVDLETGTNAEDTRHLPDAPGTSNRYPYGQLSAARINALLAIGALQRYNPKPPARIGELFALLGTEEVMMAENMCTGVRLGSINNGTPTAGTALSADALLQHALADFDSAASYATDSAAIAAFAHVGQGRVLVDMARFSDAAAAVGSVPTTFAYQANFSVAANQSNELAFFFLVQAAGVSDREGGNGLDFFSAHDPRVQLTDNGISGDGFTPDYVLTSYVGNQATPITVANGVEARLIEAEAALSSSDAATWLQDLNALRADSAETGVSGLGPLADPGSDTARVNLMFRERAFWLFATGHRQGDLRRLIRQYGRPQNTVFPSGGYKTGQTTYGSDVTYPVVGELANANLPECVNRNP